MKDVLRQLSESSSATDRGNAVRWLMKSPESAQFDVLITALERETVPQLRKRIRTLISQRAINSPLTQMEENQDNEPQSLRLLLSNSASIMRHESDPLIGLIHMEAVNEIHNYKQSRTYGRIRDLERGLDVVTQLLRLEQPAQVGINYLPDLIESVYTDLGLQDQIDTKILSPSSNYLEIFVDPTWFKMLIANAFRNANRALNKSGLAASIGVTIECSHENFSVRISNPFMGQEFQLSDVIHVGASSRSPDGGQGLHIMQRLSQRMGFTFDLHGKASIANFILTGGRNCD